MARSIRRFLFLARFPAAGALPVWVLLGYAIWGSGVSGLVGVVLLVPLVVAAEIALALLFSARAEVRRSRALLPRDAVVLAVFQAAVIGFGFFGPATAWFGLLAVGAALVGVFFGTRRLADDVRLTAQRVFGTVGPRPSADRAPIDAGEYVVVKPAKH